MRSALTLSVVACVVLLAGMANAAQPGQVSDATLAKLGLGQMHQMSDVQGLNVRGAGIAIVSGQSWATSSGLGSSSGTSQKYSAASATSNALAAGASVSVAASGIGIFTPGGNFGVVVGSVAGGGAVAYAK